MFRSPVTRVALSEKYLVSVCSEYNHVRSWCVTRFRGMISTQPGSTPSASFKIVSLEDDTPSGASTHGNDIGPYGDQDDEQVRHIPPVCSCPLKIRFLQVFVQKVVPETDLLTVRLASKGTRVCEIRLECHDIF